ncbi:MAG: HindIII restriction endonuclease [Ignavibacteria bacterium]|nr:MAG: HindIII restriction endonuclease [Ignavibacteria bacterium]KAF0162458.1 MAG: HindIII restriction endonuclease [Ignavibacteria bacterium]
MNMKNIISSRAVKRRVYWIGEIRKLSGSFADDFDRLESELEHEIKGEGITALVEHLRLCGNIPESYGHDTSEEKLYSKYTDALLSLSYNALGLKSLVLKERADAADVEVFAKNYSFVADAKSFRLSRTAKNQKDFKVQAMAGWKRGKPYAMVVCPIHQLPNSSSQIYKQAIDDNVCLFTYSHLALLLIYSVVESKTKAQQLLLKIFQTIKIIQSSSKDAVGYWLAVNRTMLEFSKKIENLWHEEKIASSESINIAKEEALTFLAQEREKIMRMSHQDAIKELIKVHKIESKIKTINAISDNGLFTIKSN